MKKSILFFAALLTVTMVNSQTVEEIVKKYTAANKFDKMAGISTVKINGKMSSMGMDIPIEMWMKNPDKLRIVMNMMGQEIINIIDGKKGYTINPLGVSAEPVEMPLNKVEQNSNQNIFNNYMEGYMKKGLITLLESENVGDKPAHKLKINIDATTTVNVFIDKASYLLVKMSATTPQGSSDVLYSDFKDNNGVFLPMKAVTSGQGREMVMLYEKVEVNIPMEDTLFRLK